MKPALYPRRFNGGHALLTTVVITAVIGLALASYLTLVKNQNHMVFRSQVWNNAFAVAEAGVEEALTHCSLNFPTNMVTEGWSTSGKNYAKENVIGDGGLGGPGKRWGQLRHDNGYFQAVIVSNSPISITVTSAGYFPMPGTDKFVSRTVQITATNIGVFSAPLVLRDKVDLNGNNILTDSYDSTDPAKSTLGKYDPLKVGDHGDVVCLSGVKNAYSVGNANIWGHALTGSSGSVSVGPNGAVGSVAWQQGGNSGIQPGWWLPNQNFSLPDVGPPFLSALPPTSLTIGTNFYTYVMGTGNYAVTKLDNNTAVIGNAVLYVTTDLRFATSQKLTILPGASLKIYCGAPGAVFGILDNRNTDPRSFMYFGLNANKAVDIQGQNPWYGCIYAPYALFTLNGHGQLFGSIVASGGKLNGNAAIHYDESLRGVPPRRGFIVSAWDEI